MKLDEALAMAEEWTKGQTFHENSEGWRPAIAVMLAEVKRLTEALNAGVPLLEEAANRIERLESDHSRMKELLKESMQFCQRIDGDGDPLNIHLARKIHMQLVESV